MTRVTTTSSIMDASLPPESDAAAGCAPAAAAAVNNRARNQWQNTPRDNCMDIAVDVALADSTGS
jgi:hypothetical protein